MSTAPEALRAEVEAAVKSRRGATVEELGVQAVLWLAAPPLWTRRLAEATEFPVQSVIGFVRQACDAGWCKARGPLLDDAPPDLTFWMPDEVRREVIDVLAERLGDVAIAHQLAMVADNVDAVTTLAYGLYRGTQSRERPTGPPEDEYPAAVTTWAVLMRDFNDPSSVPVTRVGNPPAGRGDLPATADISAHLVQRTQHAVAERDLGYAQDLVAAGEAIAGVLAGVTEQALSRARRLLALGRRRRQDERALGRYLDRDELSDAVARLLSRDAATGEAPGGQWALHLRGVGGVGKTMLIRYLASGRYAAERGLAPIPVARADFDNISADYPVRRPVQLLLELADELALHTAASDRADRALSDFRARAAQAHEAVSGLREAGGSPLRNADVARAVDSFGDVLNQLDGALLILDTCEELAKADMGDPAAPAVRAMLDIIERLHERAPSMRVLVAGRRPLPARSYLAVQPVAGFTVDEARRYLAASAARPLRADLADAFIRQSAAVDEPVPAEGQLPERVSPFDLALYAAWADEDPGLDVTQVGRGSYAYVEGRIIERLDDPLVVRALPVLAVAGRCRVATLAGFLRCHPVVLGRRLAQHEWIDADSDPPAHVTAKPALARRLRQYFESDERRADFVTQTSQFASALMARLREDQPGGGAEVQPARFLSVPLTDIDVDELLAALRLAEPADAAELWDAVAERAAEPPGRWGTVLNITQRVLGAWDEEKWPTTPALRATVTAAHIAARRRDSRFFDARGPWETVRAWADQHPDPVNQRQLLTRAALGLLPDRPDDESLWVTVNADERLGSDYEAAFSWATVTGSRVRDREYAEAVTDAAHRLLEAGQHGAVERLARHLLWIEVEFGQIGAWAAIAAARMDAETARQEAAKDRLDRAEQNLLILLSPLLTGNEVFGPEWFPPDDLLARVRIENGLIAPQDLSVLDEWESYAADHLDTIDGERLASLCLRIRLRHGALSAAVAERWEAADSYVPGRVPTGTAHHLVPPLFVSVAEAWLSAGQASRALALLDRRRAEALATRQDDLAVRHADAATVAIVRRLRLADRRSFLSRQVTFGRPRWPAPDSRKRARRALGILGIASGPPELEDPDSWRAWWQSAGRDALRAMSDSPPQIRHWRPAVTSVELADVQADLEELREVIRAAGDGMEDRLGGWKRSLTDWLQQAEPPTPPVRSAAPHPELRAAMRMAALTGSALPAPADVPARLHAEMGFEEAELMALRLPEPAAVLFMLAADLYVRAGDALGAILACASILCLDLSTDTGGPGLPDPSSVRQLGAEALSMLRVRAPELAATLTGAPENADSWRYWTEAVQGVRDIRPAGTATGPGGYPQVPRLSFTVPGDVSQGPASPTFSTVGFPDAGPARTAPRKHASSRRWVILAACVSVAIGGLLAVIPLSGGRQHVEQVGATRASGSGATLTARPSLTVGVSATPPGGPHASPVEVSSSPAPTSPTSTSASPTSAISTSAVPTSAASTSAVPTSATATSASPSSHPASSTAHPAGSGGGASAVPWIVALIVGLAALCWFIPKVVRLGAERGIGAARLGILMFSATYGSRSDSIWLSVRPRRWRTAPLRARTVLWLVMPLMPAARLIGSSFLTGTATPGYTGYQGAANTPGGPSSAEWYLPRPKASTAWWRRGSRVAPGTIREISDSSRALRSQPWERMLVKSLSPDAAGRIEWIRLIPGAEPQATSSATSVLLAPEAWGRVLRQHYQPPGTAGAAVGLRHVIGRAVASSAGPVMDVSGGADPATTGSAVDPHWTVRLLDVMELKQAHPAVVILQAEPAADDVIGTEPPDDQPEKLQLGADLAGDGVPAVLLLPVLPAGITADLARIISSHLSVRPGSDAQVLLTQLRDAISPHVPAQVLDDVVLFLNEARYRS